MQSINIRFAASANFADVHKQVAALEGQLAQLQKQALTASRGVGGMMNPAALKRQTAMIDDVRSRWTELVNAQGQYGVQAVKMASATETMTDALQRQQVTMNSALRNHRTLRNVYKEQIALQNMMVSQWKTDAMGRISADVIIPKQLPGSLDTITQKMGFLNRVLQSGSVQMINWGKNTQWAGRQLMVGFTVPFIALGAAAGMMAYNVDKELVRIQKVYDTTATDLAGQERELAKLRVDSFTMSAQAADLYGAAVTDTLNVEAGLAATGVRGADLLQQTNMIMRIATLGEIEHQQALEMTIALQNAFGLSTEQVAEKMNFMNTIENQTSLSIQDIAEATPRAATAMASLGVSVEEMTVLLVAMKERGVDAAEGANALKSATTRLLRPTPQAQEIFREMFGVDIMEIASKNAGNLFGILQDLAVVMEDAPTVERAQALSALFGTYQFNRLNAALAGITEAMGGVGSESSQTAMAMEQMLLTPGQHAATADRELQRWQQSASGQIKRAVVNIQAQLSELGEFFLPLVATVLNGISSIISWFNKLSPVVKTFILGFAGISALIGPIVMLIGLFANFAGNIVKFGTFLASFFLKFSIFNTHQKAAALLAGAASVKFTEEARAASLLATELTKLTGQVTALNAARGVAMPGHIAQGQYKTGPQQGQTYFYDTSTGKRVSKEDAKNAGLVAASAEKAKTGFAGVAKAMGAIAVGGLAITAMTGNTNKLVNALQTAAMVALLIGPSISKGFLSAKIAPMFAGLTKGVQSVGSKIPSMLTKPFAAAGTAAKGIGAALAGIIGPLGIVAAGVGLMILKMRSELKQAEEEQHNIARSAEDWAEVLGFVHTKLGDVVDAEGNVKKGAATIIEEFEKANGSGVINAIKGAKDEQEALNIALREGIKISREGGSPENVKQAMEALLGIRFTDEQVAELMLKVDLDFSDAQATFEAQIAQWEQQLGQIANNDFEQGGWEGFTRIFTGTDDLNARARQAAEDVGREFWKSLSMVSDEQQSAFFNQFAQGMTDTKVGVFEKIAEGNEKLFSENNINNATDLMKAYNMLTNSTSRYGESVMEAYSPEFRQLMGEHGEELKQMAQMEQEVAQGMLREAGVSKDLIDDVRTLAQAKRILNNEDRARLGASTSATNAEKLYNMAIKESAANGEKLSQAQQLNILNSYRRMAGMAAATSVEQGFSNSVRGSTDALDDNTNAVQENMMTNEEWASAVQNATQSAFGGARDFALSVADSFLTEKHNAQIEAIRKAGERRDAALDSAAKAAEKRFDNRRDAMEARYEASMKAHDRRWESIMDKANAKWEAREKSIQAYYDARIAKIDAAIDAEQKAEELRQRIFEAEKARVQRLQEMFSRNIDFNAALNSGDLDEAAKIMNDARSASEQWALEDARTATGDASEKRIEALNKQKDALQAELKRKLDAIKIQEEAEKKALEAKKRRELESLQHAREVWNKELQAEQERYAEGVAAARKANQERTANAAAASQRRLDIDRRNLELELLAIRASTPRNRKEYEEQIRQIQVVYDKYGVDLKAKGNAWSKTIGSGLTANIAASAASLRNDINWRKFAADIANQITSGAFGMTVAQFMTWIKTGQLPGKGGKAVDGVMMRYLSGKTGFAHTGGPIGSSAPDTSRAGYPMGGGLFSDEVPLIAKKGEYMMSDKAHSRYGTDFFDALNNGDVPKDQGGPDLGMAGLVGGITAGMIKYAALQQMMLTGMATIKAMMGMAAATSPGRYGNTNFDATQLRNAGTIVTVGKRFGANSRDLIISLMAAMQESMLRNLNYGDRDSVGLFQQRAGWGSVAQRTTPAIAAEMFFTGGKKGPGTPGLLDIKNRGSMSLTRAAQAVQRSAYPDAYAKWEDEARAILSGGGGTGVLSPGGWMKPINGRVTSPYGMRRHPISGVYKLHDGTDIGAGSGTAIKATKAGRITRASYAGAYGNWTVMDHGGGMTSAYAHQSRFAKRSGTLGQGQTLGYVGMTGSTTGPHLHFMIGKNGKWVNPGNYVPGLADGGTIRFDNTMANLHARETVLTEPLSQDLKSGIRQLDSGPNSQYNVDITFTGPVNTDIDFQKGVEKAIMKAEKRRGPRRRIGVS